MCQAKVNFPACAIGKGADAGVGGRYTKKPYTLEKIGIVVRENWENRQFLTLSSVEDFLISRLLFWGSIYLTLEGLFFSLPNQKLLNLL